MTGTAYEDRLAAAAADLARLQRRLTSLSLRARTQRRPVIVDLIRELAELDVAVESGPADLVPDVPDHGLADAVAVIGTDLLTALRRSPNPAAVDRAAAALRAALAATR